MIKKFIKNVFGSDNRSYKESDVKESDVITNIEKGYLCKVNDFIEVAFSRFNGEKNVYIDFENGHVGKESGTLSLVRLNHEIERDKPIYVIFERKRTKEGFIWEGNSYYHFSCCITEWGISLAATLKDDGNGKKRIWRISWDDIEKTAVERCISDDICKSHALAGDFAWEAYEVKLRVIKIYEKDGDYINFPICYVSNYINFADAVNKFLEPPNSIFTEEEKQYMDEVRYMLEDDDKIDEKESRLLERFRQKFNLSEDRANELKNILLSAVDLNSQELEYLKEYETFIQDGEIKERERRLLNRVANLLGISEDRSLEIENKYNNQNQ